jgi:dephospho-CoA kinase
MIVLGLTGSIGMGKSAAAQMLRDMGLPVQDADAAVHALLGPGGGAVEPVSKAFPETLARNEKGEAFIDRPALGRIVFADGEKKKALESILHPLVRAQSDAFVAEMKKRGEKLAVLDIPLLFETGGESRVDKILTVTAAPDIQRARVLARPGMTEEKFAAILAAQLPDAEKRKRSHYVVDTSGNLGATRTKLQRIVDELRAS